MTARVTVMLTLFASVLYLPSAAATDAIVKHRATLRKDPSTHHAPILTLTPPEDVELIEPAQTAGYYHVRSSEWDEASGRGRSLESVPAQSGCSVPPSHPGSGGLPASARPAG